jgi:hypothetical protein
MNRLGRHDWSLIWRREAESRGLSAATLVDLLPLAREPVSDPGAWVDQMAERFPRLLDKSATEQPVPEPAEPAVPLSAEEAEAVPRLRSPFRGMPRLAPAQIMRMARQPGPRGSYSYARADWGLPLPGLSQRLWLSRGLWVEPPRASAPTCSQATGMAAELLPQ